MAPLAVPAAARAPAKRLAPGVLTASQSVGTVCQVVEQLPLDKVAAYLISTFSKGKYDGGLLLSVAVGHFQRSCKTLLPKVIQGSQGLSFGSPQTANLPSITTYKESLPSLEASVIALQLWRPGFRAVKASDIERLVSNLCADVKGMRFSTPAADLRALLPRAGLDELQAIQAIQVLVVGRCKGITTHQADGLLSSMTGYLLSNLVLPTDVLPPVLLGPTWSRHGVSSIFVGWDAYDASGIRSYNLWVRSDRGWTKLATNTTSKGRVVNGVFPGRSYTFSLQATDMRGNRSAFAYMSPCLSC